MKSFLMIGMGRFGHHLCRDLARLGNEIIIADNNEDNMSDLLELVVSAKIGDCTRAEVLRTFGVNNFDACIVCIGTNFQNSLQVTNLLHEMGAEHVISRAMTDIHAKFLLRNGADEVVYPDRDIAERLSVRISSDSVFDYIELSDEFSIYEIVPNEKWIGKTIGAVNVRAKYNMSILAIKEDGKISALPGANHVFSEGEHLMVMAAKSDIGRVLSK